MAKKKQTRTFEVVLPALMRHQRAIYDSPARFKVVCCGRRWGKTTLGVISALAVALEGGHVWWVAPTFPMAEVGWRAAWGMARQIPFARRMTVQRRIEFDIGGGGWLQVRSASDPDTLRGEGLDYVVLDEAAYIPERAWSASLRPALSDRAGRALFIGTPSGRNWFYRLYASAQADTSGEWACWQRPTSDNPLIPPGEIERARASLPALVFSQEYNAQFVDADGSVFRYIDECTTATEQRQAVSGHRYVFGADWGKLQDATAVVVLDVTDRAVVAVERWVGIDYATQRNRLIALYERFTPDVIVAERNAMGEPILEELRRHNLPIQPFTTTAASKQTAIDALALAFERRDISIIPDPALVSELTAFEAQRLPSGAMRYAAPPGFHDDTVMALAMAWSQVQEGSWVLFDI